MYSTQPNIIFSPDERAVRKTPNIVPSFDLFGDKQKPDTDFFVYPKEIGHIVYAYSDLKQNRNPLSTSTRIKRIVLAMLIGLIISMVFYMLVSVDSHILIVLIFLVPALILGLVQVSISTFTHTNKFVGINGFAEFDCEFRRSNIRHSTEIMFEQATDMYHYQLDVYNNLIYSKSNFTYIWLNRESGNIIYKATGVFNKKNVLRQQPVQLNFCRAIERIWTIYLKDYFKKQLQLKGYLSFYLYANQDKRLKEYIRLKQGAIIFLKNETTFVYNRDDIKKMYITGNDLVLQHNNFKRNMLFFKSGNEDVIPLLNLCDRPFFYNCLSILLGYNVG